MTLNDYMTVAAARDELRELAQADGATCPVCQQFAKVYPVPIGKAAARLTIELAKAKPGPDGYTYIPTVIASQPTDALRRTLRAGTVARHWGLIEPKPERRDDGSPRAGRWRITPDGLKFVRGELAVPRVARVYDGRVLSHEGPPQTVSDALGHPFDYREIMAPAGPEPPEPPAVARPAPEPPGPGWLEAELKRREDARTFEQALGADEPPVIYSDGSEQPSLFDEAELELDPPPPERPSLYDPE